MITALCFLSVSIFWGLTWYACKIQTLSHIPVMQSVGYRFVLSAALIYLFCKFKKEKMKFSRKDHLSFAAQGLFLYFLNYYFFFNAFFFVSSGLASVVFSTLVFMNVINNGVFLKTPFSARVVFGGGIGFLGMLLVFYPSLVSCNSYHDTLIGLLLCFCATYFASIGTLISQRNQNPSITLPQRMTFSMLYGGVFGLIVSLLSGDVLSFSWDLSYLGATAYLIVFGSILGFGCYLKLIQTIGSAKAAYTTMINPIIALTVSGFLEGFTWEVVTVIGILLILIGCGVVLYQPSANLKKS